MRTINAVIDELWPRLQRGEKVHVPLGTVEHPRRRPDLFQPLGQAWPDGQHCDYVWRLGADGRIHAQCYGEGDRATLRIHHDRWDPANGFVDAVLHVVVETPVGRTAALGVAVFAFIKLAGR